MNTHFERAGRVAGALLSRAKHASHTPLIDLSLVKIVLGVREGRREEE